MVQEYSSAKSLLLVCGAHSTTWPAASNFHAWCQALQVGPESLQQYMQLWSSGTEPGDASPLVPSHVVDLLNTCSGLDCFDPRDRVYALLFFDGGWLQRMGTFRVDYKLPYYQVYFQVMVEVVQRGDVVFIYRALCIAAWQAAKEGDVEVGKKRCTKLPSWIPDWTISGPTDPSFANLPAEGQQKRGVSHAVLSRRLDQCSLFSEDDRLRRGVLEVSLWASAPIVKDDAVTKDVKNQQGRVLPHDQIAGPLKGTDNYTDVCT
jgi:hypothetical protein